MEDQNMSDITAQRDEPTPIAHIELAVDSSAASLRLAAYVRDLLRPGMRVSVVSVADNPRVLTPQLRFVEAALDAAREELRRDAAAALEAARSVVSESGADVQTRLIDLSREGGIVADALVADALKHDADLLAVGARQRHGMLQWADASVSGPVTRNAHCSMLIVPDRFERRLAGPLERIMFATDGSAASQYAIRYGLQLATARTGLLAVYVVDRAVRLFDIVSAPALEDAYIADGKRALGQAATLFAHYPNAAKTALLSTRAVGDDVAHTLAREAVGSHAELMVVGSHGRRGLSGWLLGSVARRVARLSEVPVLLVRPAAATE
jgi:nucleotide-binding universal stress UspA family protein